MLCTVLFITHSWRELTGVQGTWDLQRTDHLSSFKMTNITPPPTDMTTGHLIYSLSKHSSIFSTFFFWTCLASHNFLHQDLPWLTTSISSNIISQHAVLNSSVSGNWSPHTSVYNRVNDSSVCVT